MCMYTILKQDQLASGCIFCYSHQYWKLPSFSSDLVHYHDELYNSNTILLYSKIVNMHDGIIVTVSKHTNHTYAQMSEH